MAQWIGYMVSIECFDGRTYQGEIQAATNVEITLIKAFCDGIPLETSEVVVRAEDISDLKLIEKQSSPTGRSTVSIAKPVPKRANRTLSNSEIYSSKNINATNSQNNSKSKPIDIEPRCSNSEGSYKGSTPNTRRDKSKSKWNKSWKDEACFGSPLDDAISKDFDFEKNLALFNKQAIWDEINNSTKPDVVRHADQIRKQQQAKFRHDENIIASAPTTFRQITVPKQDVCEYVTDNGLIIPCISRSVRNKLWAVADKYGLTWERRVELMGRGAAEISLQLVGGGHRLSPHNIHQWPTIVVLCGPHRQGAMGLNAARQLTSQGIRTVVYLIPSESNLVQNELSLYKLTKNKLVNSISSLPDVVDLIIVALSDEADVVDIHADLAEWANSNRAPVLAIDPPSSGTLGILTKYSLVPVLPLPHSSENGRLYLCNLGFPTGIFSEVGIKYISPFGPKFVIPLHPNEEV